MRTMQGEVLPVGLLRPRPSRTTADLVATASFIGSAASIASPI
jgi:hypothetical protein